MNDESMFDEALLGTLEHEVQSTLVNLDHCANLVAQLQLMDCHNAEGRAVLEALRCLIMSTGRQLEKADAAAARDKARAA